MNKQLRFIIYPQPVPISELADEDDDVPTQYFVSDGQLRTPARYGSWPVNCPYEGQLLRVERLQSISEEDAEAHGLERVSIPTRFTVPVMKWRNYLGRHHYDGINLHHAAESFRTLWDSQHGFGSWDSNPWVWVLEQA